MDVVTLIVGSKHASLTVKGLSTAKLYGSRAWICLCDCGKEKLVRASDLLKGKVRSCGCLPKALRSDRLKVEAGDTFGRWTIVEEQPAIGVHRMFRTRCSCGSFGSVTLNRLMSGRSTSCGCYAREAMSSRFKTHGMSNTKTYEAWHSMLSQVDPNNSNYAKDYALRGITVCEPWLKFENFFQDMGEAPEGLTLDREDNDKGYYKENCRWVSYSVQARNKQRKGEPPIGVKETASGKWQAKIRDADHQSVHLGTYLTQGEAVAVRREVEETIMKGLL